MKRENRPFHIQLLEDELNRRKKENPRYSLRAFAKYLGLGSSSLSRILIGSQEISITMTKLILKKLKVSEEDKVLFLASIAEDKRKRSAELLSKVLDNDTDSEIATISPEWLLSKSPDLIYVFNKKKQFLYANEAASHLLNKITQELIGKTLKEIDYASEFVSRIETLLDIIFEQKKTVKIEESCLVGDTHYTFEKIYVPIFGKSDDVQAVACHLRNITARKEIEFRLCFLAKAGKLLSSSLDYKKTLSDVVDLITTELADGCFIHIKTDDNEVEVFKVAHKDQDKQEMLNELIGKYPYDPTFPNFYHNVIRQGTTQFVPDVDEDLVNKFGRNETHLRAIKSLSVGSYLCVPLKANDRVIGSMSLMRSKGNRPFDDNDLSLVEELSSRAAWCIDCAIRISNVCPDLAGS